MTLPDHLFASDSGELFDTRVPDWSHHPLRANYCRTHREITTTADLKATLRAGQYAWPGGYPMYFVAANGGALSFEAVRKCLGFCLDSIAYNRRDDWHVVAVEINYEDTDLVCDHSGEPIPSAYGSDDEPDLAGAELFANDSRGVYIPQFFAEAVDRSLVSGVSEEQFDRLIDGPTEENEEYWSTWTEVLDGAEIAHPTLGACYLWQEGDLWVVPRKNKDN